MLNPDEMPSRLGSFLTARAGQEATVVSYEPMIGGYSRLMARAEVRWKDGRTETLVLRGDPPPGKAMMETDRDVEWALLQSLTQASSIPMAKALHYDGTGSELGTKCIVLDFVEGSSLQTLLNGCDPAQGYGRHTFDLVDTMARVHRIDPNDVGSAIPRRRTSNPIRSFATSPDGCRPTSRPRSPCASCTATSNRPTSW
jgi:aminoglycoside phosphotransferase (APT) family kinase protein